MDRIYKSSFGALLRNFIYTIVVIALGIFLVVGGIGLALLKLDKEVIFSPVAIGIYGGLDLLVAFYFSFIRHNITVRISKEEVSLLKGEKIHLNFKVKEYFFTSYVFRQITPVGIFTSRSLRVINKETGKHKDRQLYFSKKNFEELIAVVTSLNEENNDAEV